MSGVKIAGIATYHPETVIDNDYFLQRFENQDHLKAIFKKVGRDKRHIIQNNQENSLTMGIASSKKLLEQLALTGKDIDIIIFASTTLEYLSPTNALMIHAELGVKKDCICFDLNANCLGMFVALEQATVLLQSKTSYQRALVIGSDYLSKIGDENTPVPSTIVGDAAASIILEKTNDSAGMIDRSYQTDSSFRDTLVLPPKGLSCCQSVDEKMHWAPFSGIESVYFAEEALKELLEKNQFKLEDVSCFLLSQFTKANIDVLQQQLNLPDEKIEYVGDQFGYTGVSSFFLAYKSRFDRGLIQKGDLIAFWTLGAGYQTGVMLWRA